MTGAPRHDMFKLPARTDTRQLVSIESLFSTEILRTAPDTALAEVAEAMLAHDVGSMLVFDAGDLVGVITERDVVRAAVRAPDMGRARVSEYMTPDPWVVPVGWTARQVAIRMINHGIQHAPVTREGQVIGVVSSFDLLAHLALSGDDGGHSDDAGRNEGQPSGDAGPVEGSER
jgi:CBS domain-containing protein